MKKYNLSLTYEEVCNIHSVFYQHIITERGQKWSDPFLKAQKKFYFEKLNPIIEKAIDGRE